jgi:hypothetical protein
MKANTERYDETTPTSIRMRVLARIASPPEYKAGFYRINVVGDADGPFSGPPRVTLYIKDGGEPQRGRALRPDEARRCTEGLRVGDLILAVGDLGPQRDWADHQEVIVSEEVRLRWRAPVEDAPADDDPEASDTDDERIVCRSRKASACYHDRDSGPVYGDEGMAGDSTYDGQSVVCEACYIAMAMPVVDDPASLAGGAGRVAVPA